MRAFILLKVTSGPVLTNILENFSKNYNYSNLYTHFFVLLFVELFLAKNCFVNRILF